MSSVLQILICPAKDNSVWQLSCISRKDFAKTALTWANSIGSGDTVHVQARLNLCCSHMLQRLSSNWLSSFNDIGPIQIHIPFRVFEMRTTGFYRLGSASESRSMSHKFESQLGHITCVRDWSYLRPLSSFRFFFFFFFQERQLSVSSESMRTKYWLSAKRTKTAQEKCENS